MATMPNYIWHCMASKTIMPKIFGIGGINEANLALSADLWSHRETLNGIPRFYSGTRAKLIDETLKVC